LILIILEIILRRLLIITRSVDVILIKLALQLLIPNESLLDHRSLLIKVLIGRVSTARRFRCLFIFLIIFIVTLNLYAFVHNHLASFSLLCLSRCWFDLISCRSINHCDFIFFLESNSFLLLLLFICRFRFTCRRGKLCTFLSSFLLNSLQLFFRWSINKGTHRCNIRILLRLRWRLLYLFLRNFIPQRV